MPSEDVAIFWDYENCAAAAQYTGYEIVKKIRHVAHHFGTIKLFKAYLELSDPTTFSKSLALRSELQSSGVSLTDCPHNGRKDVADKMILVDMLAYAIDNPPPSTIILISGDRDFAYAVSVLRLRRYRVVIISLPAVHTSLKIQASIFLDWNNDVLGADVVDDGWSPRNGRVHLQEGCRSPSVSHHRESSRNSPSFLRHAGRTTIVEFDSDLMDHLRYKGNSTAHNYGSLDSESRVNRGETSKETPSLTYLRSATSTSHEAEDFSPTSTPRPPSQTESAPAAMLTASTSTVVSKAPAEDQVESTAGGSDTHIFTPETQNSPRTNSAPENMLSLPPSTLSGQGLIKAQNQHSLPALGTILNHVPTSSPLHQTPVPQNPQLHPVGETVSMPDENAASALIPPMQQSPPKVVPPKFSLLVQRLEFHRSKGSLRSYRGEIAKELVGTDKMVYQKAGTERFGRYAALAEKAGIIELGGKEKGGWIALRPEWYNAKIG